MPSPSTTTRCLSSLRSSNYYLFELYLFLRLFSLFVSAIAFGLLLQDKLCLVTYGQTAAFCQNIQTEMETAEERQAKDAILAESTRFTNYKNILECIPMFIWSLFVGSFLDSFPGATTILLLLNILGSTFSMGVYILNMYAYDWSPYYLLLASLSISLTGGMISLLTSSYRYITLNTTEENRSLKFLTLEIVYIIGVAGAIYLGGQLLVLQVLNSTSGAQGQLRTYSHNFFTSLVIDALSFAVLYLLNRLDHSTLSAETRNLQDLEDSIVYSEIEDLLAPEANNNYDSISVTAGASSSSARPGGKLPRSASESSTAQYLLSLNMKQGGLRNFFKSLFNLDNARQTLSTFFKPRPGHARLQIFLLYLILFSQVLTTQGITGVLLAFTEKVYAWDATSYSNFSALTQLISMSLLALGSVVLVKKARLSDESLILISQLSAFTKNLLLGTFLTPAAYFTSIFAGSLSGFTVISARTKLSKIVAADEVGKIFSLSSTMDALIPIIGSLIYSNIFTATIGVWPGAIYQFSAFVMLLSLIVIVFEVFYIPEGAGKVPQRRTSDSLHF